jgi:hypothetical protein
MVELFLEIYKWITGAVDHLLGYLEEVRFVDGFLDIREDFFSSSYDSVKDLVSSLNPKEIVEGLGESIYDWLFR